jgi:alpha-N-acetylglucosaminidase
MLHNFGGRTGLYGRLRQIAEMPAQALLTNSTGQSLVGIGLTPEAIESNPIVYDLMMENTWRGTTGVTNLNEWVEAYVGRRYSGHIPSGVFKAWRILQQTVYQCDTTQMGTSGSIFASRPTFNITRVSCCSPLDIYYNSTLLVEALSLLLEASEHEGSSLTSQTTFQYDLVMVTAQVMLNFERVFESINLFFLRTYDLPL